MANRSTGWFGAVVASVGIAAALLAGAATAAADTGSGSTGGNGTPAASEQPAAGDTAQVQSRGHGPGGKNTESGPTPAPTADTSDTPPAPDPAAEQPAPPAKSIKSGTAKRKARIPDRPKAPQTERAAATPAETAETEPSHRQTSTSVTPSPAPAVTAAAAPRAGAAITASKADTVVSQPTPRRVTLMDTVGSAVLNVVMGLIQFFAGPPVLPPDANVSVRTSTLRVPVAGGRTVTADWYFPESDEPPTRLIYLQHGFGAVGSMYSYTAAALAEQTNSIIVAPTITSNFLTTDGAWLGGTPMHQAVADLFAGDRAALTASATAAAGHGVVLPTRFALVGHSAGGSLVMGAAAAMIGNRAIDDLTGVVLLDSVDMNGTVPIALSKLTGANYRPVMDISSERYVWNMFGKVGDELQAARPGQFNGVVLTGGRHIDALHGGNNVIQVAEYLVAGFSAPKNVAAVKTIAVGWINDLFAGTQDGYYPAPQQGVQIPTPAGTATAVALPFTSDNHVQGTPWDKLSEFLLDIVGRAALYEPTAGSVAALEV
ncbi:alpha/beta hydrolase [Mycobacterium sp. BMJ-28]